MNLNTRELRHLGQHWHQGSRRIRTLDVEALAAPDTINAIVDKTLLAFADHGTLGAVVPADRGDPEAAFRRDGVDDNALGPRPQREGLNAFSESWKAVL